MHDTSTDMDVTGLDSNETISNLSSSFALTSPPSDLHLHIRDIETQLEQVSLERDDLRQERDVLAETKEDLLEIVQQKAEKNTKLQKELDSKTLEFERIRDKLETELGTAYGQLRNLKEMHVIEKEALESSVLRKYLALEADFTHVQRAHLLDLRVKLGVICQRMTQVEGTEILANELGAILTTMDEKIIPHPTPCADDINIPQMSAAYWRQLFEEKDKEVTQLRHCVASLRREVEANESAFNERLATQDVAFGNCKWELRCTAAKLEDAEEELANLKAVGVGSPSFRTPVSLSSESMEEGVYQTPGWVWSSPEPGTSPQEKFDRSAAKDARHRSASFYGLQAAGRHYWTPPMRPSEYKKTRRSNSTEARRGKDPGIPGRRPVAGASSLMSLAVMDPSPVVGVASSGRLLRPSSKALYGNTYQGVLTKSPKSRPSTPRMGQPGDGR